jgi:hypothetical protein
MDSDLNVSSHRYGYYSLLFCDPDLEINFGMRVKSYYLYTVFFVFILSAPEIFAQDSPRITADRPDQSESSLTVPADALQIETGFIYQKQKFSGSSVPVENDNLILAATLLRYGVSPNVEFRFSGEYFYGQNLTGEFKSVMQGVQNISLGMKINLRKDEKIFSSVGIIVQSVIPFGNEKLRPGNFAPGVILLVDQELPDKFSFSFNAGTEKDPFIRENSFLYSGSLSYDLSGRISSFIEVYGYAYKNRAPSNYLDFGITYLFKRNIQLDFSAGNTLRGGLTDYFGGFGISLRLPD